MNYIIYNNKINNTDIDDDHQYQYYHKLIFFLNKKDCVKLALFCAKIMSNHIPEDKLCIQLVEKWLKDENSVSDDELNHAILDVYAAYYYMSNNIGDVVTVTTATAALVVSNILNNFITNMRINSTATILNTNNNIKNQYLQVLLRKTKQFENNKILEQISKTDIDQLELVDWNMITDIMQEEYNIIHEFSYEDIFSRRCLIELLRREYT